MSNLILGTSAISLDEPGFSLKEVNEQSPGSRGPHRYQVIKTIRNDQITEFRRDLGPASRFKVDEFVIPGGVRDDETGRIDILHTVGELYDIAELLRGVRPLREKPQPIDLVGAYRAQPERRAAWRKKRSTFGSHVRVQRD